MIGLDTNVLVRYIMQDDARQSAPATRLVESLSAEVRGFVTLVSVVELSWVLSSAYDLERAEVTTVIERLLRTKELAVEGAQVVWKALRLLQSAKMEFADCLIACSAAAAGCEKMLTFDRAAAKSGAMTLIV